MKGDERIRTAVCSPGDDPAYVAPGTRVRIVATKPGAPSIRGYVGMEGTTERPEPDGTYVRFADRGYCFCFWEEIERA